MMPYCEYRKCRRVATGKPRLLRMWDSYDFRARPTHAQEIWLCDKHHKKINKLLVLDTKDDTDK